MNQKNNLERRLNNRMSRMDLVSRGIIPDPQRDPNISYHLAQLQRNEAGHIIQQKISSRPSKQDLVTMQILSGQDYDTTNIVKKRISTHLNTRPGPMEVIHRLVSKEEQQNINQAQMQTNLMTPSMQSNYYTATPPNDDAFNYNSYNFQNTSVPFTNSASNINAQNQSPSKFSSTKVNKNTRRASQQSTSNCSNNTSNTKIRNITFHEFVPNTSRTGGRFVKSCTDSSKKNQPLICDTHYQQLIDQQTLFLQYELTKRNEQTADEVKKHNESQNFNKTNTINFEDIFEDDFNEYEKQLLGSVDTFGTNTQQNAPLCMSMQQNSPPIESNLKNDIFNTSDFSNNLLDSNRNLGFFNQNCFFKKADDSTSEMLSSGYGTAMHSSDTSYFETPILGFGMSNDCGGYTSVYEKVELFEKLVSDNSQKLFMNSM